MKIKSMICSILLLTLLPKLSLAYSIATSSRDATEAAMEILNKGGNAVDAAVAATFIMGVTVPFKTGIGGGGFLMVHHKNKIYFNNHREQAPASAHNKMFLDEDGLPIKYFPDRVSGPNPVGVPGLIQGLWETHKKFGKRPWRELLKPAIRLAKNGFPFHKTVAKEIKFNWPRMSVFPSTVGVFGNGKGEPIEKGFNLKQKDLARTLETVSRKGAKAFYRGELAKSWIKGAQSLGVKMTLDDLKKYKTEIAKPITFNIFGLKGYTTPPPSGSGIALAASLRFIDHYYKSHPLPKPGSAQAAIVQIETFRFFQALRNKTIADPPNNTLDPQKYLESEAEKKDWAIIKKNIGNRLQKLQASRSKNTNRKYAKFEVQPTPMKIGTTTHLSIIDNKNMAVTYTSTIESPFGSGMVVPKHGFLLNNEISDFDAKPGNPNSVAVGKRPRSNMSPLFLKKGKKLVGVIGCSGGITIPTTLTQVLSNFYIQKMDARQANAFPRLFTEKNSVVFEEGYPKTTLRELRNAGYTVNVVEKLRSVSDNVMRRTPSEKWTASNDPRFNGMGITIN